MPASIGNFGATRISSIDLQVVCVTRRSVWRTDAAAFDLTLRIEIEARWSRADGHQKRIAETWLAAQDRMGCAIGVAHALRCLELDLARD
jgi:hypothetical protein